MNRRAVLRAGAGVVGAGALAGCGGLFETGTIRTRAPPIVDDRPDAVYYPSHTEGMELYGTSAMAGTDDTGTNATETDSTGRNATETDSTGTNATETNSTGTDGSDGTSDGNTTNGTGVASESGGYVFGLLYSYAHRFWNVNGSDSSKTSIQQGDSMHLMASVWDAATGTVIPETGLSVEITQDGGLVSEETIYPMLSQPMGFHYGANFELDGEGSYTATLSVGGVNIRRSGALAGRLDEPVSTEIGFEYSEAAKNEIAFETLDNAGDRGAVEPMDMEMRPDSSAPSKNDLPGRVAGETTSGDARFVTSVLDEPPSGIDAGGPYLVVSARTPYNRYILHAMGLSGVLSRDGATVFEGTLGRTLDPELGYHYGAAVESVSSGDTLALSIETPPQVARHEGYETAFLDMSSMELAL